VLETCSHENNSSVSPAAEGRWQIEGDVTGIPGGGCEEGLVQVARKGL